MNDSRFNNKRNFNNPWDSMEGFQTRHPRGRGKRPEGFVGLDENSEVTSERRHRRGHRHVGPRGGGPRGGMGGRGFGGRQQRARRGDARLAILSILEDSPSNGYGIIKAIAERTDGAWKPSPGSVYPTLELLTDEGLVEQVKEAKSDEDETARGEFQLTEEGRSFVEENREDIDRIWHSHPAAGSGRALRKELEAIGTVLSNFRYASDTQREAAAKELARTRRSLYAILAEEDNADD